VQLSSAAAPERQDFNVIKPDNGNICRIRQTGFSDGFHGGYCHYIIHTNYRSWSFEQLKKLRHRLFSTVVLENNRSDILQLAHFSVLPYPPSSTDLPPFFGIPHLVFPSISTIPGLFLTYKLDQDSGGRSDACHVPGFVD
jgi:hypothetical protein